MISSSPVQPLARHSLLQAEQGQGQPRLHGLQQEELSRYTRVELSSASGFWKIIKVLCEKKQITKIV